MHTYLKPPTSTQRHRTVRVRKRSRKPSEYERNEPLHHFAERWAPNFYIEQREGQVLSRGMLLKYDIFPAAKIVPTDITISGGPNYRKIDESLPLCAVGQPSIHGIRTILNLLIGSPHFIKMQNQLTNHLNNIEQSDLLNELHNLEDAMILMPEKNLIPHDEVTKTRKCIWLNLREEPVIYINNRPFVLRDSDHPFRNIQSFKGITWQHLREVEQRLKRDILIEASQHHNILIHRENASGQVVPCWEAITHQTVQTSEELFDSLINEGYDISYYRVPLTPENNLLTHTIDSIFKICIKHSISAETMPYFVVNCQMGRGRSTLVAILMYLIFKKLGIVIDKQGKHENYNQITVGPSPSPFSKTFTFCPSHSYSKMPRLPFAAAGHSGMKKSQSNPNLNYYQNEMDEYDEDGEYAELLNEHGDYEVINRLLRVLSNGKTAKEDVDEAIEVCGNVYNIRHKMARCRVLLENAENDDEKELITYSTTVTLSKYCTLIAFAAFLHCIKYDDLCNLNRKFDFENNSFSRYMNNFPSLKKITSDILGLSYHDLMDKYRTKIANTSMSGILILNRIGSVLSANTILKSDIVDPQCKSSKKLKLPEQLANIKFHFLDDVGIATCSQPPSNVIESIVRKYQHRDNEDPLTTKIAWIDLREEPILYIRRRPYVVRNYDRPYQRLPEFDNLLSAQQIDNIAERLKVDIVQEAADNDNKMLVHFENECHELKESIFPIDGTNPNEIQTTKQLFDALSSKGYPVKYQKLPFNPKNSMQFEQLERLGRVIQSHIETDRTIIFSCRQGIHRSSVAAILSILIAYHHGSLAYANDDDATSVDVMIEKEKHSKGSLSSSALTSPESPTRRKKKLKTKLKLEFHMRSPRMPEVSPPDTGNASLLNMDHLSLQSKSYGSDDNNSVETKTSDSNSTDDDDDSASEGNKDSAEDYAECRAVLALVRILRKGLAMKRQVDNAIEHCSQHYHVKQAIYESRAKWESARTAQESQGYLQKAMRHLRIYTNLICFNAYLYEYYYAKKYNDLIRIKYKLLSFSQWMKSRGELKLWLNKMVQNPQLALSMVSNPRNLDDTENENGAQAFSQVFEQRGKKSSVLSGNAMLKVDYFPGCAQLQNVDAENAINFRYIDAIGVAGVAIPTIAAMQEVLAVCAQKWKTKYSKKAGPAPIIWICLREEPVLYVNNEPVVLRELHQPYENLIFTGITTKRVEAMEKTLKDDASKECAKFENKLLIHSETDTGNLEAEWHEIIGPNHKLMTCYEAYSCAFNAVVSSNNKNDICPLYHRLPITDEQAPPAQIIDTFIGLFEANPADSIFIFNCQMGRGRTTTAMVIYALWKRRLNLCHLPKMTKSSSSRRNSPKQRRKKTSASSLLNGEYTAVLTLLRILPQGKQAKKWCDDVLDILSHMQNLRKAIYQMQLRSDKAVSEKSKKHLAHRTQNYLQRYCLLIAFTSYLINDYQAPRTMLLEEEKEDNGDAEEEEIITMGASFGEWLDERAAVKNCVYGARLNGN